MQLGEREKRVVVAGAAVWGVILVVFLLILPGHEKRKAETERLDRQFGKLEEVRRLVNMQAELDAQEKLLLCSLVNEKEILNYGRQVVELQTRLDKMAKSKGIKITDVTPMKTAVMKEDLGVRKATIRLVATAGDAKKLVEFLVDLDGMPGLLNVEEFRMQWDPAKPKKLSFHLSVSTLVKEG